LIQEFGDAKLLAVLCRRAKKRCRPLWRKIFVRGVQAAGILVLYGVLCSIRLLIGTPSLKVDYLAWLSDRTRAGREETLNAKPYFDKAAGLVRDERLILKALGIAAMRPDDMNEPQRKLLADLAEHNAQAFEILRQGVTRPYYWVQYEAAVDELPAAGVVESPRSAAGRRGFPDVVLAFNQAMRTHGPGYRSLARAFYASISWRASQGQVSGALDDCLVLMDFGMHLEGRGTAGEQLVGTAIEALGNQAAFELLDRYDVAGPDLDRIQARLADLYARHESIIDVTGHRAMWLAMVQQAFTDDGTGNGRVLKEGLPLAARHWEDGIASLMLFGYPDRREMTALIDAFCNEYQLILETEPSQPQYNERKARWMALAQESHFLETQAPALDRIIGLAWRVKTARRALLTALAVTRYAQDKGGHPATLDALVAEGFLSELPTDPYSGKAFGYQRTGDGFLLYSWGENLADDGGRQGTGYDGVPRLWMNNGDWVFWPVAVPSPTPKAPARSAMAEEKAAKYKAAAPLNHTVRVERMGSYLKLDYELVGADGQKYDLWEIDDRSRPAFAVYQGEVKVGGGTFEFG
jgi:hypothetical protein